MQCWHMSGAGNDFVVMDVRGKVLDLQTVSRELCGKTGADGLVAIDRSEIADFKLHFYNSNGSRGEMCGNGARCICRFAYENGIAGTSMVIQTDAGLVPGERLTESQYRVQLNNPGVLDLCRKEGVSYVELGDPGIPHAVAELPGFGWEQAEALRTQASALRYDPAFPKGANVSFYAFLQDARVRVLTYERYVEDYTLACGTGCGAIAVTLWTQGRLPGGVLTAENRGGTLKLTVLGERGVVNTLFLEGPTEILDIFEYEEDSGC